MSKNKNFYKNWIFKKKATTLLEIIFAFLILVIATLGACGLINFGHSMTKKDFRYVKAIQILQTGMNQLLTLPFTNFRSALGAASSKTFIAPDSTNFPGVQLGSEIVGGDTFSVKAIVSQQVISFSYRPIDISAKQGGNFIYSKSDKTTWMFQNETSVGGVFDGAAQPIKAIRVEVDVSWLENNNTVPREINAVTFVVDLEN
ncbi:MAG: hypothetical protein HQM08_29310 [Candidatus Riflebacteria bacterium]|nr:hypothetical protein [Candidatus Riflebacteria bacterium]